MDLRSTLASVCRKVLHDHAVSDAERLMRCRAMKLLGECFKAKGGTMSAGLSDLKLRMRQQMDGQDSSHEGRNTDQQQQQQQGSFAAAGQGAGSGSATSGEPAARPVLQRQPSTDLD